MRSINDIEREIEAELCWIRCRVPNLGCLLYAQALIFVLRDKQGTTEHSEGEGTRAARWAKNKYVFCELSSDPDAVEDKLKYLQEVLMQVMNVPADHAASSETYQEAWSILVKRVERLKHAKSPAGGITYGNVDCARRCAQRRCKSRRDRESQLAEGLRRSSAKKSAEQSYIDLREWACEKTKGVFGNEEAIAYLEKKISIKQMADTLGIPITTARNAVVEARAILHEHADEYEDHND